MTEKDIIHGLKGDEIPVTARIIGIADAFDAMTSNRVYRQHMDMEYVRALGPSLTRCIRKYFWN
jgi:hypothetical protein